MASATDNELLTRVGPGTPMGNTMRRYWHPICTSEQLPHSDCDPLRTKLLGHSLVVFRDTSGKVGVLDEHCMHRGVSLAIGRVEAGGIRCLYHGWKFATDGTILEVPNHPDERVLSKIKAPAYPVREAGGLVWTYIGSSENQPVFPKFPFFDGSDETRVVLRINTHANYLQLFEGGVDSSHVGILHSNQANPTWMDDTFTATDDEDYNPGALSVPDNCPSLEAENTDYGYHYVAKRKAHARPDGRKSLSIRVTPVILPTCRIIPAPAFQFFVFEVPQDDEWTSTYLLCHGEKAISRADILRIMGLDDERFWNPKTCEFTANWSDRLGQDRAAMKKNWSGFSGIEQEDAILAISMGPIVDRTKEYLVPADIAVVRLRRRLLEAVAMVQEGKEPIGNQIPDFCHVKALADTVISADENWLDQVPSNRTLEAA